MPSCRKPSRGPDPRSEPPSGTAAPSRPVQGFPEMLNRSLAEVLENNIFLSRSLFEDLQERLLAERRSLIRLDVAAIKEETAQKEALVLRHRRLEQERAKLLADAGCAGLSLSAVADRLGPGLGQRLKESGAELRALVEAVAEMNALNRELVSCSLASLARHVARLSEKVPKGGIPTYAHLGPGHASRASRAGREL